MLLKFSDLFEGLGTAHLAYGAACARHSGEDVELRGWLIQAHDGSHTVMLVSRPGECPDCSGVPVAAVVLPGFKLPRHADAAVTLRGRLAFGLSIRNGIASYLRLERARISTTYAP